MYMGPMLATLALGLVAGAVLLSLGGTLHAIIGLRPSTSVVEGAGRLAWIAPGAP